VMRANADGGSDRSEFGGDEGSRKPVALSSIVDKILEDHGVLAQVRRMSVLDEWSELVGDAVARVTRARSVEDGVLIVEVRSSPWLMELNMMKGDFVRRVNDYMPDTPIERIVFVQAETE
jgi:predicted nucleic acid-binding Zn ribbon protein